MRSSLLIRSALAAMLCAGCASTKLEPPSADTPDEFPAGVGDSHAVPVGLDASESGRPADSWRSTQTYVVRRGDSLSLIAARFGTTVREIMTLNRISNPNRIREGQKLALPADARERDVPSHSSRGPRELPGDSSSYVVRAGDTLSEIAAEFRTTVDVLKQANSLRSDRIRVGDRLAVPKAGSQAKAPPPAAVEEKAGEAIPDMDPADLPDPPPAVGP